MQATTVRLMKPVRGMSAYGSAVYSADVRDRGPALLNNIRALLTGAGLVIDGYDSEDDPTVLLGKRVALKWKSERYVCAAVSVCVVTAFAHCIVVSKCTSMCAMCGRDARLSFVASLLWTSCVCVCVCPNRWYYGKVTDYSDASGEHELTYDDGDVKRYPMSSKTFYLVADGTQPERAGDAPREAYVPPVHALPTHHTLTLCVCVGVCRSCGRSWFVHTIACVVASFVRGCV